MIPLFPSNVPAGFRLTLIFLKFSIDFSNTSEHNLVVRLMKGSACLNSQYKKGVLELCVLSLLKKRDCYGYEISEFLSGPIDIADGTVYPLLRKLKSDGLLTTYLQEESGGPPRKYYKLTELGRESYLADRAEYLKFARTVEKLLEDDFDDKA